MEQIENVRKTLVLNRNQWKTSGKLKFGVGTYGKRNENIGVAWEPIENQWKTQVLRGNIMKNARKTQVLLGIYENARKTLVLRKNL